MNPIRSWEDFRTGVERVPRKSSEWTTNIYAARNQVEYWLQTGNFYSMRLDCATLFLRADSNFYRIYHVASSSQTLYSALNSLPHSGIFVADLVDRSQMIGAALLPYQSAGFKQHKILIRMARGQPGLTKIEHSQVEIATTSLLPKVKALLDRQLDPYAEQLPDLTELVKCAAVGQVLVLRVGDNVGGVLIYELKCLSAHLRYWHVDSNLRGIGIGRLLLARFFEVCSDAKRIILWVLSDNSPTIAIYNRHGFVADGLVDQIMIRKGWYEQIT
jgi:GNAT superfamily N-acetyltransferase